MSFFHVHICVSVYCYLCQWSLVVFVLWSGDLLHQLFFRGLREPLVEHRLLERTFSMIRWKRDLLLCHFERKMCTEPHFSFKLYELVNSKLYYSHFTWQSREGAKKGDKWNVEAVGVGERVIFTLAANIKWAFLLSTASTNVTALIIHLWLYVDILTYEPLRQFIHMGCWKLLHHHLLILTPNWREGWCIVM